MGKVAAICVAAIRAAKINPAKVNAAKVNAAQVNCLDVTTSAAGFSVGHKHIAMTPYRLDPARSARVVFQEAA